MEFFSKCNSSSNNEEILAIIQRQLEALEEDYEPSSSSIRREGGTPPPLSPSPPPSRPASPPLLFLPEPSPMLSPPPPYYQELSALIFQSPPPMPPSPLTFDEWLMAYEDAHASMETQAPLSLPPPSPLSSPLYRGARPPPIASPDNILLYDPVEQLYIEVPTDDIRSGEIEVMDPSACTPVELDRKSVV